MIKEYVSIAYRNVKYRKLRSFLTISGILIGIAAIISLITISQGFGNFVNEQLESIGTTRLFVLPKLSGFDFSAEGLTEEDVNTINNVVGVDWVNPYLINSDEIIFGKEKGFIQQIMGMQTVDMKERLETFNTKLEKGRYLIEGEENSIIIGNKLSHDFFDREILVNNQIEIKEKKFKVIGIFEEIGNPDDDNMILMSIDDARELFNKPDEVNFIEVKIEEGTDLDEISQRISDKLETSRDNDFFTVLTPKQQAEQLGSLLSIIQLVLGSIAAISLIVGSIGITNSMFTSVLERTRDIGTMKSIGAKNKDILLMFLFESASIGLIGGILGAALGSFVAIFVGDLAANTGYDLLKIVIEPGLLALGVFIAIFVSCVSGFIPAYKAAKLKPVEALRYG